MLCHQPLIYFTNSLLCNITFVFAFFLQNNLFSLCYIHLNYLILQNVPENLLFLIKFTSDPSEGRFDWYRQVNGGNYFMSVKQLLEAEKKICVLFLLCGSSLLNLDTLPLKHVEKCNVASEDLLWLIEFFSNAPADEMSGTDANVTYLVNGYVGRSVSCRRKCPSCTSLLVLGHNPPSLHECAAKDYKRLFENANRGGLSEPSKLCFAATALAVQCYTALMCDD